MTQRTRHPRRTSGLTLIEIAISIGLFALTIVPIYGLFLTSRKTVAESRHHTTARLAAEGQIERLRAIANNDVTAAPNSPADFHDLAGLLTTAAGRVFTVPGLPRWQGGAANGVIRVCLDEDQQFFTADGAYVGNTPFVGTDDDYFGAAPWNAIPCPSFNLDLNGNGTLTALPTSAAYRVLPVRVEVFWGNASSDPGWNVPKVAITTIIAPKLNFRRSS